MTLLDRMNETLKKLKSSPEELDKFMNKFDEFKKVRQEENISNLTKTVRIDNSPIKEFQDNQDWCFEEENKGVFLPKEIEFDIDSIYEKFELSLKNTGIIKCDTVSINKGLIYKVNTEELYERKDYHVTHIDYSLIEEAA